MTTGPRCKFMPQFFFNRIGPRIYLALLKKANFRRSAYTNGFKYVFVAFENDLGI